MGLLEYLEVIMFVFFIFLGSIVSFLDPAWVYLRSVCELKIVRKYSGSLPEVVVVLQIDETVDQLLLCFSS